MGTEQDLLSEPKVPLQDLDCHLDAEAPQSSLIWRPEQIGRLAHDLKSPLSGIISLCKFIQAEETTLHSLSEVIDMIHLIDRAASDALQRIQDILTIVEFRSQCHAVVWEQVAIAGLIESVIAANGAAAAAKQTEIAAKFSGCDTVLSDPRLIFQIVGNLLSNAIKYSPPGSVLNVNVLHQGAAFRIEVKDRGPGFSVQDRERIFHMFARLSGQPTGGESSCGMGLYIVDHAVKLLNGKITFHDRRHGGTMFAVSFPQPAGQDSFH